MSVISFVHMAYGASLINSERKFVGGLKKPLIAQSRLLKSYLKNNQHTEYGQYHRFSEVRSIKSYQDIVPITDYDGLEPWIDRIKKGEKNILTDEPIFMFEKSGGSTGANKYIPYTQGLLCEFTRATNPWIKDLYNQYPELGSSKHYWSISPAIKSEIKTEAGIPIGFENDTEYFGQLARWAIQQIMAVPQSVKDIRNWEEWKKQTALHLLKTETLGLFSVWSPTFLICIAEYIVENCDELASELQRESHSDRAELLRSLIIGLNSVNTAGSLEPLWPKLGLISCWTDGESSQYIERLRTYFPTTPIQGKGLLATEGVVTVPYKQSAKKNGMPTRGAPLAITSHFLEFNDLNDESARPKLAHELRLGAVYSPILTTAGGLYRYQLKDAVVCVDKLHKTPCLSFQGKADRISDLCGEKLHAKQVESAINKAKEETGLATVFIMIAPKRTNRRGYMIFVEANAVDETIAVFTRRVEQNLMQSHHYSYCRNLGQLDALESQKVKQGTKTYQGALLDAGYQLGSIKPSYLEYKLDWTSIFSREN
ncbi:MAG: GH3 auxin-responsive promoter family protein [Pseudomonadales bacterium]|nr:GH3 auxin-responsive promoter family protein [Pseudomonadales bacterium]